MAEPTFIQTMVNQSTSLNLAPYASMMDFILQKETISPLTDMDWTEYDKGVQATLDQYWPNTSELTAIKRMEAPVKSIYTAVYQGNEVIVKSTNWSQDLEDTT